MGLSCHAPNSFMNQLYYVMICYIAHLDWKPSWLYQECCTLFVDWLREDRSEIRENSVSSSPSARLRPPYTPSVAVCGAKTLSFSLRRTDCWSDRSSDALTWLTDLNHTCCGRLTKTQKPRINTTFDRWRHMPKHRTHSHALLETERTSNRRRDRGAIYLRCDWREHLRGKEFGRE